MDLPHQELAASLQAGTFPGGFVAAVTPIRTQLEVISRHQLDVMDRHYPGDLTGLQDAFELFGQGVLFDGPRRPPSRLVHMMDSPANPIGFRRWHAMIRAMVLLGIDADRWSPIDPLVALAWGVHGEAKPRQNTVNPPLPAARLDVLRAHWLNQTPAQLDAAFSAGLLPTPLP